jgi:hypothetical protein
MTSSRPIVPPAHRPLPRAPLRRSWGHSASRGTLLWTAGTISKSLSPGLTKRLFPAQINGSVVFAAARDHHHLEAVITIVWNH